MVNIHEEVLPLMKAQSGHSFCLFILQTIYGFENGRGAFSGAYNGIFDTSLWIDII